MSLLETLAKNGRVQPILRYGTPSLLQTSELVEDVKAPDIQSLVADMSATLLEVGSVAGLAAPQIGINKHILYYNVIKDRVDDYMEGPVPHTFLVNPTYTPVGIEILFRWEGCLSLPDMVIEVPRYLTVKVNALTLEGESIEFEACGFHAKVLQHEIDHLDGILHTTRMTSESRMAYLEEAFEYLIPDNYFKKHTQS